MVKTLKNPAKSHFYMRLRLAVRMDMHLQTQGATQCSKLLMQTRCVALQAIWFQVASIAPTAKDRSMRHPIAQTNARLTSTAP
jgi:hypothetical protein